ncbi:hypothetical protein [Streptomyces sp. NPDC088725]|uniref:hypothetical protein n=1 Tax=Streptomyces sp. NPDC088725 TaxID=3365873 RepID=UPI003806DF6D
MSDKKTPRLSHAAQHEQDQARVSIRNTQIDIAQMMRRGTDSPLGAGGSTGSGGRTSFEGHDLNAMIDLVEHANPADLESAGNALWDARDALRDAAQELQDYVDKVEWKGESGTEFRSFGRALAEHARNLGTFAETAGTQIVAAGTGLSSVHKSMPPRDSRAVKKPVDEFLFTGPEYDEAVKVEANRQEAINQMNRLASFYSVSEETLAGEEPPEFGRMLKASVPRPDERLGTEGPAGVAGAGADLSGGTAPQPVSGYSNLGNASHGSEERAVRTDLPNRDRDTSLEINSVAAPPSPAVHYAATSLPASNAPASSSGGFVPPSAGGFTKPVTSGVPRPAGTSGTPRTGGQNVPRADGRSSPTGRPGAGSSQNPVAGRPGSPGGNPSAGRAGTGGPTGPRPGRASGIVGGTPQPAASGPSGSRMPRGTVVGGQGSGVGRPSAGRPGQQGVIGASPANDTSRPGGRSAAGSNGVVGTPRGSASGSRPGTKGFTQGGAGLVRGPAGRNRPGEDEHEETGSSRPDYLTEDEQTWTAGRRSAVPPVIE